MNYINEFISKCSNDTNYLLAQIFGFLAVGLAIYCMFQKRRSNMMKIILLYVTCFTVEYILLGAISGAISNFFGIIRTIFYTYKNKNEFFKKNYIMYIFLGIFTLITIIFYERSIDLIPLFACLIATYTMWDSSPKKIRYGNLIVSILWASYALLIGGLIDFSLELFLIIGTIISIIKFSKKSKTII